MLQGFFRINLKTCDISASSSESLADNRCKWQELCHQQIALFHGNRLDEHKRRQQQRKDGGSNTSGMGNACHICDVCGHNCRSDTTQNVIDEIHCPDSSVYMRFVAEWSDMIIT